MNIERDRLHRDLVILGDMIGDGLHYEDPSISREYRKIAKKLYPHAYQRKHRKPTQAFLRTLKVCSCGQTGWAYTKYSNNSVGFKCKSCNKNTGECKSNADARDKWNNLQ